mmetsp:Transcript_20975/g.39878  ORF Transcript_20975/g.39878 Transcript_20975/m.39878 type:complete len:352 (-) Transcript_20975:1182-2237(-)|eukprot:CAMPEP_0114260520 /NCGR_PEP_ID=MMETSP0058-20121206/20543_1 /TAXON_ID=36894 /ORGANISM="Pyramimonas parkeae, CCMP726" /LENGTH=351 /DNA_ID=CAMNT_0001375785 /DNA_START=83 /DNA_END=1138 /DNA_ORIENTATION=-
MDSTQLVWNFAYGANVNRWKLETRRGIVPHESAQAVLRGWQLSFNHTGGMGTVEMAPGKTVHGVLHLLDPGQFKKLNQMENGYDPTEVTAWTYSGVETKALVYVSKPHRRISGGVPPLRYLKLLQQGAREWGLHDDHVRWLETHAYLPENVCRGFARGSCRYGATCRYQHASREGSRARLDPPSAAVNVPDASSLAFDRRAPETVPQKERALYTGDSAHVPDGPNNGVEENMAGKMVPVRRARVQSGALARGGGGAVLHHSYDSNIDPHSTGGTSRSARWRLVYWPGFRGRGEFARLLFEVTGEAYVDETRPAVVRALTKEGKASYPVFAAPILEDLETGFQVRLHFLTSN